jgi:uroporphyrinogen-III synthase
VSVDGKPASHVRPTAAALVPVAAASTNASVMPLSGYNVAVATDRRHHPIAAQLDLLGAHTVSVQATRTVAQPVPDQMATSIREAIRVDLDEVIVSSAFGLRQWFAAARALGLAETLLGRLRHARLLARDARAADGLRELGLTEIWSTPNGTTEDLFGYLMAQPASGRRVLAQLDGEPLTELTHALRSLGVDVVEVLTYHMQPPNHRDVLRRLAENIVRRQVDGVILMSPSCTENLIEQTIVDGTLDEVLNAAIEDILVVCLGPLTAQPLIRRGVRPRLATRPDPQDLLSAMVAELPRHALHIVLGGKPVQIRGQALIVGEAVVPVQPGPVAVLRALARQPGRVLSPAEIRTRTPGWSDVDDHAIEMAVSRLRRCLEGGGLDGVSLVQTVVKRGYRLAL